MKDKKIDRVQVAALLKISPTAMSHFIKRNPNFPPPIEREKTAGADKLVYDKSAIEAWISDFRAGPNSHLPRSRRADTGAHDNGLALQFIGGQFDRSDQKRNYRLKRLAARTATPKRRQRIRVKSK